MVVWLAILLALAIAPLSAQTRIQKKPSAAQRLPPPPPDKWPIRTLAVEGNRIYTAQEVLAAAGLKTGDVAGKADFDAAHDRLLATGAFSTVGYKYDVPPGAEGSSAVIMVTENDVLPVRFYQLGAPDSDLEAWLYARQPLFSAARLPSTQDAIARWTQWIQEYLAAHNLDTKILGDVEPWPTQLAIVFRPARNLPAVAEVNFEGSHAFSAEELRAAVAGAAVGAAYTEGNFRLILDSAIRPVYESKGFLRVGFPEVRAEPAAGVQGVRVRVTVEEGEPYKFGKLLLAAPTPLPAAEVLRCFDVRAGALADFSRVADGLEKARKLFRRSGYLNAQAASDRAVHDADRTVDVSIRVDAGAQYTMGRLEIAGLDLEAEAQMKRAWGIKAGAPFDPDYPQQFLDRIRNEGLFDNLGKTTPATRIDEKSHTADVTLTFAGLRAPPPAARGRRQ
ncbi:MAG TPA: POTRA domain-containing protein [Bryobacteraceae bacterium]|nr:POTRA domain-containing protein [Bryobacteraceae bacterium]